jgi:O-acetyl-ADP-ribose deacetylase (regulator of RNase III)
MTVSEAVGDLFDPKGWTKVTVPCEHPVDALGHGVNCLGKMGSGIAVKFREDYPHMYTLYKEMCDKGFLLPGMVMRYEAESGPWFVYNIASQYRTGADAHLDMLETGLVYVRFHMKRCGLKHLALPRIGAGIGGLSYPDVLATIRRVFERERDIHVTVVSLEDA